MILLEPSEKYPPTNQDVPTNENDFEYSIVYETPEELYADFHAAIINKDLEAFKQTLYGDAMENYGDEEGLDSWWYEIQGYTYDRFELLEDAWIWQDGEKVPVVAGFVWLKKEGKQDAKLRVIKVENSWRVIED